MDGPPRADAPTSEPASDNPGGFDLLLVEDNPGDARLVQERLTRSRLMIRFHRAETLQEALRILDGIPPDLILLDLALPDARGLSGLERVRERAPDVPVVVLTGTDDRDLAVRSLQEGAQDYLTKDDASPEVLERTIRYARERASVQDDLQEAQRQLRLLDENLEEVFYLWDFESDPPAISYCSSAYERIWGRPVEELEADPKSFLRAIHPDDRQRVETQLEEKLRGERPQEYRVIRPDGEIRWIRDQSYPIRDNEGEMRQVAGTAWDITDRKELERELQQAAADLEAERSRLQEVFREAPVFMATLQGPDHLFEMVNPAYWELVGDRELVGLGVREALPELVEQGYVESLDRVYRTGETVRHRELAVELRRDGATERRFLNLIHQPRRKDGSVSGVIVIGVDVTGQVEARKRADRRRETLERLLETTAEGVLFAGPDGRFRYANPAAEEMLGLDERAIASRDYRDPEWEITGPDGGPFPEEKLPVARVLRTGEPVHGVEHGVVRPDGTRVILSVNAAPVTVPGTDEHGVVASLRDVTERRRFEEQLRHRALHDQLTGLPNRALFQDRLKHALERAGRTGESVGVLFLDLDRFKKVNDSLGHEAGDRLLSEVARRLRNAVRGRDTVARMGGDEFTALLEDVEGLPGLREAAERVLEALEDPVEVDGREIVVDVSLGAALSVEGEESWTDLVRQSDHSMYLAKRRPGSRLVVASEIEEGGSRPDGSTALEKESRLRDAVEADLIDTVYQPIVSLEDRTVRGMEALARWTDPVLGRIPPLEFIRIAEETGLIIPLGEIQLRRACREAVDWIGAGLVSEDFRVHVNLSARQLEDPDVVRRIRGVLDETGLPPENLYLEVTESTAVQEQEGVTRLKALGVGLSVDDFGTEYSTLAQLRLLPLDEIKIDRSFVQGLPADDRDVAIVRSVLALADSLGLNVVAEGIEEEEQLTFLRGLGCALGQGYYLSEPAPPDEVEGRLTPGDRFPPVAG